MHIVVTGMNDTSEATSAAIANMKGGNVVLVVAADVADILSACNKVATQADPVSRIDIVGHAAPGYISLSNQGPEAISCTTGDVLNLAKLVQVFGGQQPLLCLAGCNTALHGEHPRTDGPVLLAWLAHAMPGVRISGTRCEFQSDAFGPDGLMLGEDFFYTIVHGDSVDTIPEPKSLPEDLTPVESPIDLAFREAAVAGTPPGSAVGEWLARAANTPCVDASHLLTAFRAVVVFTTGRDTWRIGYTRSLTRLMLESGAGRRFLFPSVLISRDQLPPDDPDVT